MATLDALNQQLNTYNTYLEYHTSELTKQEKVLNTIKAGLLDYTAIGEEEYFKQTGTERLEKKEVPRYTDIYNKEFSPIKDIRFTFGNDVTTSSKTDTAFYVFNPEQVAKQKTEQQISEVEENNRALERQNKAIKEFLANEKEVAKKDVLNNYLSDIQLNSVKYEYDQVDLNTPSGLARWNKANRSSRKTTYAYDLRSKKTKPIYSVKLSAAESAEKKKLTTAIETTRFMSSPTLQKTYAERYTKDLEKNIASLAKNKKGIAANIKTIQEQIARL
jgi:hypothetical protein